MSHFIIVFLVFLDYCIQVCDCVHAINDVCILLLNNGPSYFHCGT